MRYGPISKPGASKLSGCKSLVGSASPASKRQFGHCPASAPVEGSAPPHAGQRLASLCGLVLIEVLAAETGSLRRCPLGWRWFPRSRLEVSRDNGAAFDARRHAK